VEAADHGTHVAGTVAGRQANGKGMATGTGYGAKLAFFDIGGYGPGLDIPGDLELLLEPGRVDAGAKIHVSRS
jgi:hypothetical protein